MRHRLLSVTHRAEVVISHLAYSIAPAEPTVVAAPPASISPERLPFADDPPTSPPPLTGTLAPMVHREAIWKRGLYLVLAGAIAACFLAMTHLVWVPAHSGVDQNGYLVGGRMFADHFSTRYSPPRDLTDPQHQRVDESTYVGSMWIGTDLGKPTERYYPKYPIGLPVLVAIALKIGGSAHGVAFAHWISPIGMTLSLAAIFLLVQQAAGSFGAILAVLVVAGNPMALGLANNPNSHASSLCFVCWGMFFLVRWWQKAGWWRAAVAGLLLGYAVTIRYTEALLLFPLYPLDVVPENKKLWHALFYVVRLLPIGPIGIAILCNLRWRRRKSYLQAGTLLACWALPVAILLLHNKIGFGKLTGYDPTNESEGFRWEYFMRNWETMLRQMHNMGLFFLLPLGLAGQLLLCVRRPAFGLAMLMWTLPSLVLYTFYYWAPDTNNSLSYLRFFLTIVPPLTLGAVWLLTEAMSSLGTLVPESPRRGRRITVQVIASVILLAGAVIGFYYVHKNESDGVSVMSVAGYLSAAKGIVIAMGCLALALVFDTKAATAGLIVAIAVGIGASFGLDTLESEFPRNLPIAIAREHVVAKAPPHSIVFSSEDLLNHLQFAGDYQLYTNRTFGGIGFRMAAAGPNDPQLVQPDRAKRWAELMKGKTEKDQITQTRATIAAAIGGGQRVFIALPSAMAESLKRSLTGTSRTDTLTIDGKTISTWDEPSFARRTDRRIGNGGGPVPPISPRRVGFFGAVSSSGGVTSWELIELTLGKPGATPTTKPGGGGAKSTS